MPLVRIEVREGRTTEAKKELLDAVHGALMDAFEIPDADRQQRLVEYNPDSFDVPPGSSDDYVLVTIDALPGRTMEAKKALYASILNRFEDVGIDPQDVLIVLREIPLQNWAFQGHLETVDVPLDPASA